MSSASNLSDAERLAEVRRLMLEFFSRMDGVGTYLHIATQDPVLEIVRLLEIDAELTPTERRAFGLS